MPALTYMRLEHLAAVGITARTGLLSKLVMTATVRLFPEYIPDSRMKMVD